MRTKEPRQTPLSTHAELMACLDRNATAWKFSRQHIRAIQISIVGALHVVGDDATESEFLSGLYFSLSGLLAQIEIREEDARKLIADAAELLGTAVPEQPEDKTRLH